MRKQLTILALLAAASLPAQDIFVNTPRTTLLLKAEDNKPLHISYYGDKVTDAEEVYRAFSLWQEAYPAFGLGNDFIPALSVRHADGNMSTELVYQSDKETKEANATVYTITMKDKAYDFYVDMCYRAYDNCDVIEAWSVIRNGEKKPVTLLKYASAYLPVRQGDVWVSHEHGNWGAEAYITEEPLKPGIFEMHDLTGNKNSYENRPNMMLSLDGKPQENSGRTIGAVLCWSGNFRFTVDTQDKKTHHLVAGQPVQGRDLHHPGTGTGLQRRGKRRCEPQLPPMGTAQQHGAQRQRPAQDTAQLVGRSLSERHRGRHGEDDGRREAGGRRALCDGRRMVWQQVQAQRG